MSAVSSTITLIGKRQYIALISVNEDQKGLVERDSRLCGNVAQVVNDGGNERDALLGTDRLRHALWVAGDERTGRAGGGFRGSKGANPMIDLAFEFVRIDESGDLKRAKEMADPLSDLL